mmetsp:Transcript_6626/g.19107  ORF Transcript_6626/g.19107 Transcript_6626/m.19107 type:complete len:208 (+) Transcript_6626:110-733(+)
MSIIGLHHEEPLTCAHWEVQPSNRRGSSNGHDVVDLEDHAHTLSGQGQGGGCDQQGLHHVLRQHVRHLPPPHIDARVRLPAGVPVAQLRHNRNGREAGVLREGEGHNLQSLCEGSHTVALHPREGLGPLSEGVLDLHLGGGAARHQGALVHQAPQHAQRVVHGALRLLQHQLVAAPQQHRGGAPPVGHPRHLHHLPAAHINLLHKLC